MDYRHFNRLYLPALGYIQLGRAQQYFAEAVRLAVRIHGQ